MVGRVYRTAGSEYPKGSHMQAAQRPGALPEDSMSVMLSHDWQTITAQ